MVTTPIDPIRVPTLNLSQQELDEIEAGIEQGKLPRDFLERHFDAVDANVFGVDAPKDKQGFRTEQGLGSPGNQTANSLAAYRRFCRDEAGFAENVKRMEAELAASDKARRERAAKSGSQAVRRRAAGRGA